MHTLFCPTTWLSCSFVCDHFFSSLFQVFISKFMYIYIMYYLYSWALLFGIPLHESREMLLLIKLVIAKYLCSYMYPCNLISYIPTEVCLLIVWLGIPLHEPSLPLSLSFHLFQGFLSLFWKKLRCIKEQCSVGNN